MESDQSKLVRFFLNAILHFLSNSLNFSLFICEENWKQFGQEISQNSLNRGAVFFNFFAETFNVFKEFLLLFFATIHILIILAAGTDLILPLGVLHRYGLQILKARGN